MKLYLMPANVTKLILMQNKQFLYLSLQASIEIAPNIEKIFI